MKYELNEKELNIVKQAENINLSNYGVENNLISVDYLVCALADMIVEYDRKCEELDDLNENINQNYTLKNTDYYDEIGMNIKDF